jgi:hypothetical protein
MVLRWSTFKIVFSDPDLGSKWPPSADIVLTKDPMGKLFKSLLFLSLMRPSLQLVSKHKII